MLDDAGCWTILAAMIAFIICGCILTNRNSKAQQAHDDAFDGKGLQSLPPSHA
jgi:hypothetical protein